LVRREVYCRWKNFVKVELQEIEMGVLKLSISEMDKGREEEDNSVRYVLQVACSLKEEDSYITSCDQ
jgi:glutamyl-tRNA reductase